jgi:hypothetical protein
LVWVVSVADDTNAALWSKAQRTFHDMLQKQMAVDDQIDDAAVSRRVGILEAAAIIEDMKNRAERAPTPSPEVINLLQVLLDQVVSLLITEGGEK